MGLIKRYKLFLLPSTQAKMNVEKIQWQNKKSLFAPIDWLISSFHLYCHVADDENALSNLELSSLVCHRAIVVLSNL